MTDQPAAVDPEQVWSVCKYIEGRNLEPCRRCAPWETDPDHGKVRRVCYGLAQEVVNIVLTGHPHGANHV